MTVSEAYDYLNQIRTTEKAMARLELAIQQTYFSLYPGAVRYDKDRVNVSPDDPMAETFSKLDEMERELKRIYHNKAEYLREIYQNIEQKMPEDSAAHIMEKNVVVAYYIGRKSIAKISEELNYSVQHVYRLRNSGVETFAEVMTDGNNK